MASKQRFSGLDMIRALATLLVMTTHSVTYLGLMGEGVRSLRWTAFLIIRFTVLSSVPLFLLLTGYLNRKKQLSRGYFRGMLPVVISYIVIAILSVCYTNNSGQTSYTVWQSIHALFSFTAHGYAWYVEMYLGLFLLIPFLNKLFDALETFRSRMLLCVILCIMTNLPAAVESFRVGGVALDIIPEYWEAMYPLSYYFIGVMIGEYQPKIRKIVSVPLTALAILIPSGLCWLYSSAEAGYAWYMMNGFSCITTGAIAVMIFLVLYDVNLPGPIAVVFRELSVCSFEMYLFSY
ncbi:MAG: acyltransferase family protein, partial [Clostridia bacterium]|nr:acyltransferase family protein [Clostridia bacterium]